MFEPWYRRYHKKYTWKNFFDQNFFLFLFPIELNFFQFSRNGSLRRTGDDRLHPACNETEGLDLLRLLHGHDDKLRHAGDAARVQREAQSRLQSRARRVLESRSAKGGVRDPRVRQSHEGEQRDILSCQHYAYDVYYRIKIKSLFYLWSGILRLLQCKPASPDDCCGGVLRREVLCRQKHFHAADMRFCCRSGILDGFQSNEPGELPTKSISYVTVTFRYEHFLLYCRRHCRRSLLTIPRELRNGWSFIMSRMPITVNFNC